MNRKVLVVFLLSLTAATVTAQGHEATLASCVRGATATEIIATFRVQENTDNLDSLNAYSWDGNTEQTGTGCSTTTFTGGIAELVFTFDTGGTLPCGIEQDGTDTTKYNIRVHVVGASDGINQAYRFSCTTSPTTTVVEFDSLQVQGGLGRHGLYPRTYNIKFLAMQGGSDLPASTLDLGQSMYYSLIFDPGTVSYENTNWGRSFHVGFLNTDPASVLSVEIYTPAHGTRVSVSGIDTTAIDSVFSVTRDQPYAFTIPSSYQPTSTTSTWNTENKGIKIEGLDDVIGVRVNSDNGYGQTDSYVAFPDDALEAGRYRLPTMSFTPGSTAQAVVVATVDSTTITVTHDDGGTPTDSGGTLNAQQTYHLFCGLSCQEISIVADQPVAVITGNGQDTAASDGHVMTPGLPATKFGKKFVLVELSSTYATETRYKVMYDTPDFTTLISWLRPGGAEDIHDGSAPFVLNGDPGNFYAFEFEVDPAANVDPPTASVTQFLSGIASGREPSMVTIPPVEGWGTVQVIPLKAPESYLFMIVTTKGKLGDITFQKNDACCDSLASLSVTPFDVEPHTGVSAKYEYGTMTMTTLTETWVKFQAPDNTIPFMVLAYEVSSDNRVQAYVPFGQRTPTINPAGGCQPVASQAGIYPGVRLGNGLDDDCDGTVDEEKLNGIDDDGDGEPDEDLATGPSMVGDFVAIANVGLDIAATQGGLTSGPEAIIGTDGCNTNAAATDPDSIALQSVGHFTASAATNTKYPDYWTLKTSEFPAFRFTNTAPLWAKATVVYRESQDGISADSCSAKRKRRDLSSVEEEEIVYLHLNIIERNNATKTEINNVSCWNNAIYWSGAAMLVVTILTQIAIIILLRRSKQFRH